jgi:hypothetical protein
LNYARIAGELDWNMNKKATILRTIYASTFFAAALGLMTPAAALFVFFCTVTYDIMDKWQ